MPKATNAGLYPRRYDLISEEDNDNNINEIDAVLEWMKGVNAAHISKDKSKSGVTNAIGAIRNLFSGRKVKTSALTVGIIVVGAVAGFVLGTFVLPGVGSAIGGTVGGIFTTTVVTIGGMGFTAIGTALGIWLAPKITKRLFKSEYTELSKNQVRKLSKLGVSSQTADLMSNYLQNREKSVKSPLCKSIYQTLRKEGMQAGDPERVDQAARFFCHELVLLEKEIDSKQENEALMQEIEIVKGILANLAKAHKLSYDTRNKIRKTLQEYEAHQKELRSSVASSPALSNAPGENLDKKGPQKAPHPPRQKAMQFSSKATNNYPRDVALLSLDQLDKIEKRFKKSLDPAYVVKKLKAEQNAESFTTLEHRYRVKNLDNTVLTEIDFQEEMRADNHSVANLFVDRRMGGQQREIAQVLAVHTKAYLHKAPYSTLTVVANSDDVLATELMAAALSQGLAPVLDNEEYPSSTPESKARKEKIIHDAHELANMSPKPKKKIGFKMDTPKPV